METDDVRNSFLSIATIASIVHVPVSLFLYYYDTVGERNLVCALSVFLVLAFGASLYAISKIVQPIEAKLPPKPARKKLLYAWTLFAVLVLVRYFIEDIEETRTGFLLAPSVTIFVPGIFVTTYRAWFKPQE